MDIANINERPRPFEAPDSRVAIALVISSLGPGGAERVLVYLANHWAAQGHAITLITFASSGDQSFYTLDPAVERRHLNVDLLRVPVLKGLNTVRQARALRRELRRLAPQVVVSFITKVNIVTLLATSGSGVPVIVSERVDPRTHRIDPMRRVFRRWLYPRATSLVMQTNEARSYFPPIVRRRSLVLPNPVFEPESYASARPDRHEHLMVGLGRLDYQKGFDMLIRAFERARQVHPGWRLEIWGEGSERPHLLALIRALSLESDVTLPGLTTTPNDVLANADLFVLPSRQEGFPNALCEAMAVGLPVVAFACPSGPADIIRDGIDGVLVRPEDVDELTVAIGSLMADPNRRSELARRAREVTERFGEGRILAAWDSLLDAAIKPAKR